MLKYDKETLPKCNYTYHNKNEALVMNIKTRNKTLVPLLNRIFLACSKFSSQFNKNRKLN